MPRFLISFAGREGEGKAVELNDLDSARNEAVRYLGVYLAKHPGFANEGHWRVNVEDADGNALLHVIVATVTKQTARFSVPPERALYGKSISEKNR